MPQSTRQIKEQSRAMKKGTWFRLLQKDHDKQHLYLSVIKLIKWNRVLESVTYNYISHSHL